MTRTGRDLLRAFLTRFSQGGGALVGEAVGVHGVTEGLTQNVIRTPLSEIESFTRFVGGFAGNVATGLARLGVQTTILSRVGDDGHGEFCRAFLEREGVDTSWLGVDPTYRTALSAGGGRAGELPPPSPCAAALLALAAEPSEVEWALLGDYGETAALLGRRTAELHRALAGDGEDEAFAPDSFTPFTQRALYQARALIPEDGTYRVLAGPGVAGASELTEPYIDQYARYPD